MGSLAPALIQAKLWLEAPCPGWLAVKEGDDADAAPGQTKGDGCAHDASANDGYVCRVSWG